MLVHGALLAKLDAHPLGSRAGFSPRRQRGRVAAVVTAAFSIAGSLLVVSPSAHAQITAIVGGNPNHIDLALPVKASVSSQCGGSISGVYTVAEINAGFEHDFALTVHCNVRSRIAVQSLNGGLLAAIASPPPGYSNLAPYQVALHLVGEAGVPSANGICDADTLNADAAPPCSFRGPASLTQGLELTGPASDVPGSYLRVGAVPYRGSDPLVASPSYADTLTVTLSAAQ